MTDELEKLADLTVLAHRPKVSGDYTNAERLAALGELRRRAEHEPAAEVRFEGALKVLLDNSLLLQDWQEVLTEAGIEVPPEELRDSLEDCLRTTVY